MTFVIGLAIGIPVGWMICQAYRRFLYRAMIKIRRQMHGGTKRRRRH